MNRTDVTAPVPTDRELQHLTAQIDAFAAALRPFQKAVHQWMRRYGRYDVIDELVKQSPAALPFVLAAQLAHIHSEAAEAFEEVRNMAMGSQKPSETDPFAVELADILLALVDVAEYAGRDLGNALKVKVTNEQGKPHGPRGF